MIDPVAIPGYRLESLLGKGGMASVFLAVQESFERQVALKVMSPLLNSDPSFAARFKRETRIVAQLSHASIVPVFDVGEHQARHYLSMEYLPGGDLKRRILQGQTDLSLALKVCTALCTALDVAHRKGFVHRDIKPENILFRADGTPVLTDFGIARALDSGQSMTAAGMLVGTPSYMSPEQVKGLELDGRSDLYCLGIVFFEMLTGTVPFKADSTLSTALKHVSDPLPPLPPEYAAYQEFLDCLTAKDREERFASGAEVIRALRVIGTGRIARQQVPTPARTPSQPSAAIEAGGSDALISRTSPLLPSDVSESTLARPAIVNTTPDPDAAPADVMSVRSQGNASPRNPSGSRTSSRASAWHALAKPTRKRRRLLLGAAVVAIALAIGTGLLMIAGSDKGAGPSSSNSPVAAVHSAAKAGQSETAEEVTKALPPAAPQAATPPADSPHIDDRSVVSPTTPGGQLAPSGTSAVATAQSGSQPSPQSKRLTEEQRQRKQQKARLIERYAAELRTAQLQEQETRILELLTAARNEYAAGALWQPAGASAADRYREILRMQPGRAEAVAGAARVANVLAAEAEHSEAAGDIYTSGLLVDQIQSLQPDHQKLSGLKERLGQLVANPMSLSSRDRERFEKAAKYIARAEEDLRRQPLDYRAESDAVEQYDKAVAAAPLAPGLPSLQERLGAACLVAVRTELSNNDPKRAAKLIGLAHKRNWASEELDQLEASMQPGGAAAAIKQPEVQ